MPSQSNVTLRDIYEVVERLENKMDQRIKELENDVEQIKDNQNKALGVVAVLSLFFSAAATWMWNKLTGAT